MTVGENKMTNQSIVSLIKTGTDSYENREAIRHSVIDALDRINAHELLHPGQMVLIKPNLVSDRNYNKQGGTYCLYTQPEVIEPVVEYVCCALKGCGTIVIGDAPVQECDFEKIRGIYEIAEKYKERITEIKVLDFRELISVVDGGVHKATINKEAKGKIVNLGKDSAFFGEDDNTLKKLRITNYDPRILLRHHKGDVQEYYISEYALDADVIINMPKPKAHRKAGMTGALKNFIGVNIRKEFLPHHTLGSVESGGDEYKKKNIFHDVQSNLLDKKNICEAEGDFLFARLLRYPIRALSAAIKLMGPSYAEGSWYGNDTISRTILDVNRAVLYANKDGVICNTPQRSIIILADMIVSGEGEGPLMPSPKAVGMILAGTNPVCFDEVVSTLMGFDYRKIPSITRARDAKGRLALKKDEMAVISSNSTQYDGKTIETMRNLDLLYFEPSNGWKGHIEKT
jgi:uncharacterized protein (DUF362 family)